MEPHNFDLSQGIHGSPTMELPSFEFHSPDSRPPLDRMTSDGKRKRVGFSDTTPPSPSRDVEQRPLGDLTSSPEDESLPRPRYARSESHLDTSRRDLPPDKRAELEQVLGKIIPARPALKNRDQPRDIELNDSADNDLDGESRQRHISGTEAHNRAQRLAAKVGSYNASATPSRNGSFDGNDESNPFRPQYLHADDALHRKSSEDSDEEVLYQKRPERPRPAENLTDHAQDEANRLIREFGLHQTPPNEVDDDTPLNSGQITPVADQNMAEAYIPRPHKFRGGVLASLLTLGARPQDGAHSPTPSRRSHAFAHSVDDISLTGTTPLHTPGNSPRRSATSLSAGRPHHHRKWKPHRWSHSREGSESSSTLAVLAGSSLAVAQPNKDFTSEVTKQLPTHPGTGKRAKSSETLDSALRKFNRSKQDKEQIRIKVHIAQTIMRHKYIVKLCKALMDYGAPTHRLEEYLKMSSRVLEIEAQFLYIPGCMLISFDDPQTHTTEVKLVRTPQGVDLGKLRDTHAIYKEVVHDQIDVVDATGKLERVMQRPDKFNKWFRIVVYGFASASVGPFAFDARFIDLPIAFLLGCIVGWLQLVLAPVSDLYANVFEVGAAVLTAFFARGFGSIPNGSGGRLFCFSALSQSSIALILPGYTVLCASLELKSRSIVAGSIRMVYAIIYSLFLGYGITIGSVLYGWADRNATSATTCSNSMHDYWFFFFVPAFTICLCIINQAKWKQAPVMLVIAFAGYLVNYFSARRFRGNAQVTQTIGAFTIGVLANLYARLGLRFENWIMHTWTKKLRPKLLTEQQKLKEAVSKSLQRLSTAESGDRMSDVEKEKAAAKKSTWTEQKGYGMAAAAMLPAIFVQVPSGLAVSGSLVAGITSADQIVSNSSGTTTVSSGTDITTLNGAAFTVSLSVIQIAIGITVGLFLSAVVVYPLGKKRSGLFSF